MTTTYLPEVVVYGHQGEPIRNGVYKRKVFIQGTPFYARYEDGKWFEGSYIEDNFTDEQHAQAYRRASITLNISPFRRSSVWWGLAEEPEEDIYE